MKGNLATVRKVIMPSLDECQEVYCKFIAQTKEAKMNNLDNKYNALSDVINALSEINALVPNSTDDAIEALKEVTTSTIDYLNSYSERIEALNDKRKNDINTEALPTKESETLVDDAMASPEKPEEKNILSTILDVHPYMSEKVTCGIAAAYDYAHDYAQSEKNNQPEEKSESESESKYEDEYERDFININAAKTFVLENLNVNPHVSEMVEIIDQKTDIRVELHKDVASQYLEKAPTGVNIPGYGFIDSKSVNEVNADDVAKSNDVKSNDINKLRIGDFVGALVLHRKITADINIVYPSVLIYYDVTVIDIDYKSLFFMATSRANIYHNKSHYNCFRKAELKSTLNSNVKYIDELSAISYNSIQRGRITLNDYDISFTPTGKTYKDLVK